MSRGARPPGCARTPRRPPAGFTLIELVLVLVVMAIATVLVAPALQPALESVRAEAAARHSAAFLDDVRRRSVLERRVLLVRCRPELDRLDAVAEGEGPDAPAREFRIPEEVDLVSCSPEEVRYQPQGSATGIALLLRDRRGREYGVTVGAFTGLARIEARP